MKRKVNVTFTVEVEIDDAAFTPKFMAEFSQSFYRFDMDGHFRHIAQLKARDILEPFTEGYGPLQDMGIKAEIIDQNEEILDSPADLVRGV